LDVKKENVVLLFGEIIKEFQNNVSYQQEHVLLKKFRKCRIVKRGRCHRNVCCSSERKNNRLIKKKML